MKTILTTMSGLLLATSLSHATLSYTSPTVTGTIPDGNPGGISSSITVSGAAINTVRDVNVTLQISGGYNGDLFGYLVGPDGALAVLLNRIGVTGSDSFGNSGAGMNLTLDDSALNGDIHLAASGVLTGSWASDGRNTNPLTVTDGSPQNATLDQVFAEGNGHTVNGTWTLFLADMAGGDVGSLVSWGLNITVVPEPTTWALVGFTALLGAMAILRRRIFRLTV